MLNCQSWVNAQPLANPLTCLGDGRSGGVEHRGSDCDSGPTAGNSRLVPPRARISTKWAVLSSASSKPKPCNGCVKWMTRLRCLRTVRKNRHRTFVSIYACHRHRRSELRLLSALLRLCSIGSGAVESAIKQIDRRIQISGAQWNSENVPQVLAHRCAYLNGLIGAQK